MDQTPPKETRAPINLRIKFRSESVEQFIERYAMDVSRGGIFIRTREPLAVGTPLRLDFQFQNGTALMAGDGTVVWIREFDASRTNVPPGMGVRFDKLTPESLAVLEQLLTEKSKRERGGASAVNTTAGGIAVRRPSSMFSALEAQVSVGEAPSAAKPGPTEIPPANSSPPDQASHAATRSLGTTHKPFSAASLSTGSGHEPTPPAPVVSSSPSSSKPTGIGGFRHLTPNDGSGSFDDINDEPTQIAGRLPSFLTTDEEATSVGSFPFAAESASRLGEKSAPVARGGQAPSSLAGRLAALHPTTADLGRQRPSLDDGLPPGGGGGAHGTAGESARGTSTGARKEAADLAVTTPALAAISALRSSAIADAASSVSGTASATSAKSTQPSLTTPASTSVPAPAPAPAKAAPGTTPPSATATAARSTERRSPAAAIGVGVVVLGASAIFLARFFGSQATESVPMALPSSGTLGTAEPATVAAAPNPGQVVAPSAEAPQPPTPTPTAQPAANVAPTEPSAAVPVPTPTPPPSETSAPQPGVPPKMGASVVDVSAATAHKGARHRATHAARETGGEAPTSGIMPPEGALQQPIAAAPAAPVVGSPGQVPEVPTAAPEDGSPAAEAGHQLRVTSKPVGADVTLDGQTVGKTPYAGAIQDISAPHFIAVRKDGFEPYEQMISSSSAWTKSKGSKGKPGAQVLKINTKLKQLGGGGEGKGAPEGLGAPIEAPAKVEAPPKVEAPAKSEAPARVDRPLPPSDETAPKAGQ